MDELQMVVVDVGNTRARVALARDVSISEAVSVPTKDLGVLADTVQQHRNLLDADAARPILIASVDESAGTRLASALRDQLPDDIYIVGDDLPVPVVCDLAPETVTGIDRLLNACAAWSVIQQACIVVDAGTAVTVDFIDGEGVFHGGVIAPGAQLQLNALHSGTDALPDLEFTPPKDDPMGRSTAEAMLHGVAFGLQGLVRTTVEHYAEFYGAFPQVVATGGDAEKLFQNDELIDRIVPDLTVLGMAVAAKRAMRATAGDEDST